MYGVYRIKLIKEFRNSSWYQSQVSETLIPSGHLLFRPSLIPAKSFWPYLNPIISLSLSLIPAISPCSQSQGRKHFPVSRIVVRKHSPPATFPANFSGELSGDGFFSTPQGAPGGDLQFVPKHRNQKPIHAPSTRAFSGRRLQLTRRRVRVREPLSSDALPPPSSSDADQPPFLPVLSSEPCTCLFWGSFASVGTSISFSGVLQLFFLNSNPCTCLGKCSSTFPVHDKIRNGIITSIQRHVTKIRGQI